MYRPVLGQAPWGVSPCSSLGYLQDGPCMHDLHRQIRSIMCPASTCPPFGEHKALLYTSTLHPGVLDPVYMQQVFLVWHSEPELRVQVAQVCRDAPHGSLGGQFAIRLPVGGQSLRICLQEVGSYHTIGFSLLREPGRPARTASFSGLAGEGTARRE